MKLQSFILPAVLLTVWGNAGCLIKRTPLLYGSQPLPPHVVPYLLTATAEELNDRLARIYAATKSFQATTDMTARVGNVYSSFNVTEINESFTAYILFRNPSGIRVVGKIPVIGSNAFDMSSGGEGFRLSLPTKKLFVTGSNSAPASPASNPVENMRPAELLATLVIRPQDAATERMHIEDDTDVDHSWYILQFTKRGPNDTDLPDRSIWFDRLDLHILRQRIFDDAGLIISDTKYEKWQPFDGVIFPTHIDASFKKAGYGVAINTSAVKMNQELGDEKFALEQPEGSTLRELGSHQLGSHQ